MGNQKYENDLVEKLLNFTNQGKIVWLREHPSYNTICCIVQDGIIRFKLGNLESSHIFSKLETRFLIADYKGAFYSWAWEDIERIDDNLSNLLNIMFEAEIDSHKISSESDRIKESIFQSHGI